MINSRKLSMAYSIGNRKEIDFDSVQPLDLSSSRYQEFKKMCDRTAEIFGAALKDYATKMETKRAISFILVLYLEDFSRYY